MIIEDQQLEVELQELYLTGKQWLSDIDFMMSEQSFLEQLVTDIPVDKQDAFRLLIGKIKTALEKHRSDIIIYMHKLEPLILKTSLRLEQSLIEDFINLQQAVTGTMDDLKMFKYRVVQTLRAA